MTEFCPECLEEYGECRCHKGGGRESGGEATYKAGVGTLPTAAANPAALERMRAPIFDPFWERIRELEAELAETKNDVRAAMRLHDEDHARVERAEALLRDASMQIRLMRDNNDELKARAKELEILIKGKFTTLGEVLHARESRSSPARKE